MKNSPLVFVIVSVLVMSCLSIAAPETPTDMYEQYRTFSRIVATVDANYVDKVDREKLFYGAYEGMLQTLDPYSMFLPPQEKEDLEIETKGEFGGLGIEITADKNGVLTVITPIEDTPAFKAGILAGDRIVRIEGKTTKGLSLQDAIKKLRGKKGTSVTVTVYHESGKLEDITVVRDIIKLESVKDPHFVDDKYKIAYLRLTQFQENSAASLDATVKKLQADGMKALVLDVRFNPGGLLKSATEIADRFLEGGVIVSTRGRASGEQVVKATKEGTYPNFPVAVLVSGRSASAAEILAGAIQDHKRGLIVGTRTFGKASVQSLIKLEDGKSALRLTTAHYYTPSGRLIHHNPNNPDQKTWGIEPDIEVKTTLQDEIDLWEHWRQEHLKQVREKNHAPTPDTPEAPEKLEKPEQPEVKDDKPAPKDVAPDADIEELVPDLDPGKGQAKAKEFRDTTLEAAVNALKGMILAEERQAAAAPATPAPPVSAPVAK